MRRRTRLESEMACWGGTVLREEFDEFPELRQSFIYFGPKSLAEEVDD